MKDAAFESEKEKYIKQKVMSLEILEQAINEERPRLEAAGPSKDKLENLEKAQVIANNAVDRIRAANETELRIAVENADTALRSAHGQLRVLKAASAE